MTDKRVVKEKFTNASSGSMQGYAFNLRRPLFADVRLRRAFNLAYDWETSDRLLSNGEYHRDGSYFDGIPEFMATGIPEGAELQILETMRDKVPAELFTTPYKNPVGGNAEAARNNLREAARLLKEAGFEIRDRKLIDPKGQPVTIEFLCGDPGDERGVLFYKPSLEQLGMAVNIRTVDSVQYQNRTRSFDFDIVTVRLAAVAVAGQRTTRFLWIGIGGPARFAQYSRHQESRGRCLDRPDHLRQGSRRSGRELQGAGSGIAVEQLRRSAIRRRI